MLLHTLLKIETRMPPKKPSVLKPAPAGAGGFWREKLRCPGFLSILLFLAAVIVYLPAARNQFVNYDDPDYVTSNDHVQSGLNAQNLTWAFTTGHASNWHPLTWISHMIDCQVFGVHPGPQHLVNVAFHALNTVLLFLVLRSLTGATRRSAFVAALFALHPLHVESVAWISERKDVLSTAFFLLTLGAYGKYAGAPALPGAPTRRRSYYSAALGCFALGLMSKPMLVTLPFVLLLLDYWPLQRLDFAKGIGRGLGRLVVEKLPFLALSAASSLVTFLVQKKGGAVSTSVTFGARVANAVVSYARYLAKTVWPSKLSILYPHPGQWPLWQVACSAALLIVLTGLVVVLARKRGWLAVGWLWFVGILVPAIGLIQVGIQSMADRYTYIPAIGLFVIVAWGLAELVAPNAAERASEISPRQTILVMLGGFALAACALLTVIQVHYWHDSGALFRHAVEVTKNNYLAYNNLGFYLSGQGKIDEALENYRKSVEINPNYEDALNNLGYALAGQNKNAEAIPYYEAALRIRPLHTEVHNNLGNALSGLGRNDEAIAHYRIVLEQNPKHADAHNNLGIALAMQGKVDEAIPHFRAAIRFKSDYASAHSNLGNALAVQRKFEEAIQEYQASLALKPDDAQAHNNLGNALAEQGQLPEACAEYRKALRLNANNPEANFNLGVALARQGNKPEAANHLREALRLRPDYAEAQRQLNALPVSSDAH